MDKLLKGRTHLTACRVLRGRADVVAAAGRRRKRSETHLVGQDLGEVSQV
jgi:hypothetical protein